MNGIVPQKNISVAGIDVAQDQAGRYCLNDLHRAAGGERRHGPSLWLENQQTQELAQELSDTGIPVSVVRGGAEQGTFACKELVYSYAMWISPKFHLQVIRTFDAVATGQLAAPLAPTMTKSALSPAKEFRALFGIARLIGLDKNAAAISANQGTTTITGTNMLALMGQTHLAAEVQELCFTPSELGARLCLSGIKFNQRLAERGMQERINGIWVPTDKGAAHSRILDTGKSHGGGTPIQQVKWLESVMVEVTA